MLMINFTPDPISNVRIIANKESIVFNLFNMSIALASPGDGGKKPPIDPLQRTKRPFGGLFNDMKRRFPLYASDFKDGLNLQCLAAAIFMYFAALSGAIAFGGLLGNDFENRFVLILDLSSSL